MTVHLEACPHLHSTVHHIRSLGKRASVSLNPHSPLDGLDVVLPDLAMVLLMTVNPGFGGQKFIEGVVPKIRALREEITRRNLDVDIEVDGGITPATAPVVVEAERTCSSLVPPSSASRIAPKPSGPCASAERGRGDRRPTPGTVWVIHATRSGPRRAAAAVTRLE